MSEAKAKYLAAKAAFEETFEKHLQNGVEFISDQVFICLLYTSDAADE
mgnify:CR=1 FL=1